MDQQLAIIEDTRYQEHQPGESHPENPNRLRVIHELIKQEFNDLPHISPRLAVPDEIALIHDRLYIDRVAQTEGRAPSRLDPDTGVSARSYEIARLATGGLLEAVDTILGTPPRLNPLPSGERTSNSPPLPLGERAGVRGVFAFVRPPGHHAEHNRGMGFCIFNNIAIAARYAQEKYKLNRILIVDWDLHHGNGTQHSFYDDPRVLFFSSHQYPYYPGTGNYDEVGTDDGEGFTVNAPFPSGFGDPEFIAVYERILKPIALEYKPELVLVSAGFDPYTKDPLGGMQVTGNGFGRLARMVREIAESTCGGRMILTLEGGYHPDGLREGVRAVLQSLSGQQLPDHTPFGPNKADYLIQRISDIQKQYWKNLR